MARRGYKEAGSALLLTVMVISVLTVTTLGTIATRFDQLSATSQINDSAVAKLAADSGLAKLREKLTGNGVTSPIGYDLATNTENPNVGSTLNYRPNPRNSAFTVEQAATNLPRCLSVAVLSPWLNSGKYLFGANANNNPAMIFQYANIVNDTLVGTVPANSGLSATEKALSISQLTGMGHFYNPFAPGGSTPGQVEYWTVKMGGPEDQFLTQSGSDGSSSYYRGLDLLYAPYLPKFIDSGLPLMVGPSPFFTRQTADQLRTTFENRITNNNFKVWLDASITDDVLYQNGFADLFADNSPNRIRWLQPNLWNDTPEIDMGAYVTSGDINNAEVDWTQKPLPTYLTTGESPGWSVGLLKTARPLAFIKFADGDAQSFSPGKTKTGLLYGSLDGLRLQQPVTVQLLAKNSRTALTLCGQSVGSEEGFLKDVRMTSLATIGSNLNISILLANTDGNYVPTPKKSDCTNYATNADIDMAVILPTPQYQLSTPLSFTAAKVNYAVINSVPTTTITPTVNVDCVRALSTFAACPAVGDLINLSKADGTAPMWGKVTTIAYSGSTIFSLTVDKLRTGPKPVQQAAVTNYTVTIGTTSTTAMAVYGGEIDSNYYDGGSNSELNELWIYTPINNTWTFMTGTNTGSTPPPKLAGASLVYDKTGGGKGGGLVLFGGYYYENVTSDSTKPCGEFGIYPTDCLYTNWPGFRVAKRLSNAVYAFHLVGTPPVWEYIDFTTSPPPTPIANGTTYQMRLLASLADRSGMDNQAWRQLSIDFSSSYTLDLDPAHTNTVKMRTGRSPAGIAKGDELYVTATGVSPPLPLRARVTAVNFSLNQITFSVLGYDLTSTTSITIPSGGRLYIQVINRVTPNTTCSGELTSGVTVCTANNGNDDSGLAVGDLVSLEQKDGSNNIIKTFYGYISDIDVSNSANPQFYFFQSEKANNNSLNDFTVTGNPATARRVASQTAVSLPEPQYGAQMSVDTRASSSKVLLWNGGQKSISTVAHASIVWHFNDQGQNYKWIYQPLQDPTMTSDANNPFTFQVVSYPPTSTVATTSPSQAMFKDKSIPDPNDSTKTIFVWNDAKSWTLTINTTSPSEFASLRRTVQGSRILVERRKTDGSWETFHGSISNAWKKTSPTYQIDVQHNSAYPGDSGLGVGNSDNAAVTLTNNFDSSALLTGAQPTDNQSEVAITVSNADLPKIPPIGATIHLQRSDGTAYTMTIAQRSYQFVSANNSHHFTFTGVLTASPINQAFGTSYLGITDTAIFAVSRTRYQTGGVGWPGGVEWLLDSANVDPTNTTGIQTGWKVRFPTGTSFSNGTEHPAPRLGAASAQIYDPSSKNTTAYLYGGTRGQYATGWKQTNVGSTPTWQLIKASASSGSDLPSLFGGSLVAYVETSTTTTTKGVYFGGKQKTDNATVYSFGTTIMGLPDTINDASSFFLPDSSSSSSNKNFFMDSYTNYPSSPTSLKNTFGFVGSLTGAYTACPYLAESLSDGSIACGGQQERHLGLLGRMSSTGTDTYKGYSWGRAPVVTNPGSNFLKTSNGDPNLLIAAPAMSLGRTTGRWDQNSYNPYQCDVGAGSCLNRTEFGTLALGSNYASNKSLMYAGYAHLADGSSGLNGGSILVTTVGVGTAIVAGRPGNPSRGYSYCNNVYLNDSNPADHPDYTCKDNALSSQKLTWLPDPEDLLFLMNAAKTIGAQETYRVVGYYGNIRRGYLVVANNKQVVSVQEIAP